MTEIIEPMPSSINQDQLARELVEWAHAKGVELVDPGARQPLVLFCREASGKSGLM